MANTLSDAPAIHNVLNTLIGRSSDVRSSEQSLSRTSTGTKSLMPVVEPEDTRTVADLMPKFDTEGDERAINKLITDSVNEQVELGLEVLENIDQIEQLTAEYESLGGDTTGLEQMSNFLITKASDYLGGYLTEQVGGYLQKRFFQSERFMRLSAPLKNKLIAKLGEVKASKLTSLTKGASGALAKVSQVAIISDLVSIPFSSLEMALDRYSSEVHNDINNALDEAIVGQIPLIGDLAKTIGNLGGTLYMLFSNEASDYDKKGVLLGRISRLEQRNKGIENHIKTMELHLPALKQKIHSQFWRDFEYKTDVIREAQHYNDWLGEAKNNSRSVKVRVIWEDLMKRLYQAPQDNENLIRYFGKVKRANGGYGGTFISSTDLSRFAMELVTLLEKNSDIF